MTSMEAINIAKVAMQKFFTDVYNLKIDAKYSDIEESRNAAVKAIMDFAEVKKQNHEKLNEYEKKALGTFDAANLMLMTKLHMTEEEMFGGENCGGNESCM